MRWPRSAILYALRRFARPLLAGALGVVLLFALAWAFGTAVIVWREPDAFRLPTGTAGRLVDAASRPVHVVERGDGPPLLLVHGFGGSTYDFEEHVQGRLAARHRTIAVDLHGMGFSARDDAIRYGLGAWANQLVALMDALGVGRAAVVGFGLGGAVASVLAGEHPDRVERLVLVASCVPLEPSEQSWWAWGLGVPAVGEVQLAAVDHLPRGPGFTDAYHDRMRAVFRIDGTRHALLATARGGEGEERLLAAYREIAAPTLFIHGTADDVVPHAAVLRAAPLVHDALVLSLDGAGHWLLRDQPDRVGAETLRFLGGPS